MSRSKLIPGCNDLATVNPELAKEWHPKNNEGLTPDQVTCGSNIKVWWQCEKGHEWQAFVFARNKGNGCPDCSPQRMRRLKPGQNDLAIVNPSVAAQWHPTKNGELTPDQVTANSNIRAWWLCENGHEWDALIFNRNKGQGCPQCAKGVSLINERFGKLTLVRPTEKREAGSVVWECKCDCGNTTFASVYTLRRGAKKILWLPEQGTVCTKIDSPCR